MAFGFIGDVLGDVVEGIGDVFGKSGSSIGSILGSTIGAPVIGAVAGRAVSEITGQQAVSTPSVAQSPRLAAESQLSGVKSGPITQRDYDNIYTGRQIITGGLPSQIGTGTAIGTAIGTAMDLIPDIEINKFFGGNGCQKALPRLVGMTKDGCPTVTRKQQRVLRNMAQYMPLESVAYEAGVSVTDMARLISKTFPPRSKGISGAQLRTANRVNNKILNMAHKLGYDCKPMTTTKRGCK